jgi:hypothetical protein
MSSRTWTVRQVLGVAAVALWTGDARDTRSGAHLRGFVGALHEIHARRPSVDQAHPWDSWSEPWMEANVANGSPLVA